LYRSMFIAYFMAFVLSCETIGSIRVLASCTDFLMQIL
jgi:hypothetical protein